MDQEAQQQPSGEAADGRGPVDPAGLGKLPPAPPPGYWPPPWPAPRRRRWPWVVGVLLVVLAVMALGAALVLSVIVGAPAALLASAAPREVVYRSGDMTRRIVILPLEGLVAEPMEQFARGALKGLAANPPAALVVRVDSPGGGVGSSDRIWHMLKTYRQAHPGPVVASMGSLAASGGYYISVVADKIVAEPTCVTGSIGVMMPGASFEQLLQKVGVTPHVTIASGAPEKDVGSPLRAWTERDRLTLQAIVDQMHERFVRVVAEGRGMSMEQARTVANGAPLTAEQALGLKLVDSSGYLDDAIEQARELAGLEPEARPAVTIIRGGGWLNWLGGVGAGPTGAQRLWQAAQEAAYPALEYRAPLR